jgi:hypothetical protein
VAIGGGYAGATALAGVYVTGSYPDPDPRTWTVSFYDGASSPTAVTVYAVCIDAPA